MKTVPKFLRGPYRSAMRLAMEEALHENDHQCERGWKLFLLLLRFVALQTRTWWELAKASWPRVSKIFLKRDNLSCST